MVNKFIALIFIFLIGCAQNQSVKYFNPLGITANRNEVAIVLIPYLKLKSLDDKPVLEHPGVIVIDPGKHKFRISTLSGVTQRYIIAEGGKTYLIHIIPYNEVVIDDVTNNPEYHLSELP